MASSNGFSREQIKMLWRLVQDLNTIGPYSSAPIKCNVTKNPFLNMDEDDTIDTSPLIICISIFPDGPVYEKRELPLEFKIEKTFPGQPPLVRCAKTVYHPNVDPQGQVCAEFLELTGSYKPTTTFVELVQKLTLLMETPSTDRPQNPEAAKLHQDDRIEYNRRARQAFEGNISN